MRIRAIQLMALMTCLLVTGPGCSQVMSAPQTEVEETPATLAQTNNQPASEPVMTEAEAPPSTRPKRGPSALETAATPQSISLTPALQGVVELLKAGVEEEVLLKHINNSPEPFEVGSDEIIFLTDLGAPGHVISAMMGRDEQIQSGQATASPEAQPREPWPPAGTVAQIPTTADASYRSETLPAADVEPVAIEAPTEELTVDYFQNYLAPYGTWIDVPQYGLCWQPTVAVSSPGWMPYGDRGRWVYTDHGWYWYSDYSWGWTAFHYGRWFHHTQWGWCWSPGTVWGPSWVSWRYSAPYCGWAPLPPYSRSGFYFSVGISWGIPSWCYTYVPSYRICTYYPRRHAVHHQQAREIHGRSKSRDHYAVGRNHTIENRGIPPTDLTDNAARDIQRAQIQKRNEPPAGNGRRERLDNDGKTLTVYQPGQSNRTTDRPQTASRTESQPATRAGVSSPRVDLTRGSRAANTALRDASPERAGLTSGTRDRSQPGNAKGKPDATRSSAPTSVASTSTVRSPGVSRSRSEPAVRERSTSRTTPTRPNSLSQPLVGQRSSSPTTTATKADSSLVIIGQRDSQRTTPTSTPSRVVTSGQSTPTSRSAPVATTPGRSRPTATPVVRSQPRSTTPSTRTWSTVTRTEPTRSVTRVQTRTIQSPSVTRTAPAAPTRSIVRQSTTSPSTRRTITTAPQVRATPTRPATIAPSTQRIAPSRAPARSFAAPAPSVRSAPTVRSAPSVSRAPQRAPSYSSPPTTRSAAPAAARSAPRSAPPSRSGSPSGNRSR